MVTRTKKIFVGGLSANTVVEDVKQYFEQFGKVSCSAAQRTYSEFFSRRLVGSPDCTCCSHSVGQANLSVVDVCTQRLKALCICTPDFVCVGMNREGGL